MVLDAANLDAILQEARSCFLYEDAPDYLAMLEQGMQRLVVAAEVTPVDGVSAQAEYTALMRAAHSLKGGAGIAQMPSLHQLAHKLEDLLQALLEGRAQAQESVYELLFLSVEQVKNLVDEATSYQGSVATEELAALPIVVALDSFLKDLPEQVANLDNGFEVQASGINPLILKTVLEIDLEDCLQRVEGLLQQPASQGALKQALAILVEECTMLGQTLSLAWLLDAANSLNKALAQSSPLESVATEAISQLRQLRAQTLNPTSHSLATPSVTETDSSTLAPRSSPLAPTQESQPAHVTPTLNLRIPVTRLDRMNNMLGELLISHERLSLYLSQLNQASFTLKKEAQQLNPINEQVQALYDQLATPLASSSLVLETANSEFDPLQFDQYTAFHSTLQNLQEVMVRVQETRADVDLIGRDFQEALEQLRQQLDSLRGDLTQSRLVPFSFLAERFITPLQTLNQRHHKSVELAIVGKDILIDQVILEQLQTPLTHLLRNAFDHGIETADERLALGKPDTAQITLTAAVQGNQVVIAIADDGRGIDIQSVYQRAQQMGLYPVNTAALTKEQILEFLFMPGFSTATAVTDLSGRGVGLDVVRLQVERLRGLIQIETKLAQGTTFTIKIPLTLSILPLLLCRCQQRTLAIPSINVLEVIALPEFEHPSSLSNTMVWQNRSVPLFSLTQLLPYPGRESSLLSSQVNQKLGIVLDVGSETIVVAVDSLLGERELVLKPFDTTVKVPSYVAGCTVLGTGEVVPVLSPNHFSELIIQIQQMLPTITPPGQQDRWDEDTHGVPTILVVDDSVTVRRLLDRVLNQSGYQVVQCRDGREALEALNRLSEHYDLVISDVEMPRLDGFSLLREIRSHPRWHSLAVAMLTSRENEHHRQKATHLGANAYFTKPFHPTELLPAIAALLA